MLSSLSCDCVVVQRLFIPLYKEESEHTRDVQKEQSVTYQALRFCGVSCSAPFA